jgi:hypothetical protein
MNVPRGHHHLPKFLMKGFASRIRKKQVYVHLFSRTVSHCEPNINGIGKQRDFHGQNNLEERFSERESQCAAVLEQLRQGRLSVHDKPILDEFISLLAIRTKWFRDGVSSGVRGFFQVLKRSLESPAAQIALKEKALDRAKKSPQVRAVLDLAANMGVQIDEARFFNEALNGLDLSNKFQEAVSFFEAQINETQLIAGAHITSLSKNLYPSVRIAALKNLEYSLQECSDAILGDVGPVCLFLGSKEIKSLASIEGEILYVFLPITTELMLVGGVPRKEVDSNVNEAIAALSREFFISAMGTEREYRYLTMLGTRADLVDNSELTDIVMEALLAQ